MEDNVQEVLNAVVEVLERGGVVSHDSPRLGNLRHYNALRRPDNSALKTITGGNLNGKTDINPQWRLEAMTRQFGPVGIGWGWRLVRVWMEKPSDASGVVLAFAEVAVWYRDPVTHDRSEDIPGIGGNEIVKVEGGFVEDPDNPREKVRRAFVCKPNDEAYKMAVTDALSVAFKTIGVGGDIYAGAWDGSKYIRPMPDDEGEPPQPETLRQPARQAGQPAATPSPQPQKGITDAEAENLVAAVCDKVLKCDTATAAKAAANACLTHELALLKARPKDRQKVMGTIREHIEMLEGMAAAAAPAAGDEGPLSAGHGSRILRSEEGEQA